MATGEGRSVTLTFGTAYPPRVLDVDLDPRCGAVSTVGFEADDVNVSIGTAVARDPEVADSWSRWDRIYGTGVVRYQPNDDEFGDPPTAVYENSLLAHRVRRRHPTRAAQRLVDGRQLSLVTVNSEIGRSSSKSISLDLN